MLVTKQHIVGQPDAYRLCTLSDACTTCAWHGRGRPLAWSCTTDGTHSNTRLGSFNTNTQCGSSCLRSQVTESCTTRHIPLSPQNLC